MTFPNFKKLQSRYWVQTPLPDPAVLVKEFSEKIYEIEKRDFGVDEDKYIITVQAKVVINGLALKIYEFLRDAISLVESKQYVATISLLRLCLEHIAMLCFFNDKLRDKLKNNDRVAVRLLLHSFCAGERIFFVDAIDKETGTKRFSTRAEHLNSALRHFDRKYPGLAIQIAYDVLSNHTHVSPTSSVRMLYRQKVWDKPETKMAWRRVRLSTKSNSHEQLASAWIEETLKFYAVAKTKVINEQEDLHEALETMGKQIHLVSEINEKEDLFILKMMKRHDSQVQEFLSKFFKYGTPETKS